MGRRPSTLNSQLSTLNSQPIVWRSTLPRCGLRQTIKHPPPSHVGGNGTVASHVRSLSICGVSTGFAASARQIFSTRSASRRSPTELSELCGRDGERIDTMVPGRDSRVLLGRRSSVIPSTIARWPGGVYFKKVICEQVIVSLHCDPRRSSPFGPWVDDA